MDPRKLLQATHMQQEYIPQKEIEPTEEKKVTVVQTKSINKEKKEDYKKESEEAIPTAIKKVKREDRDLSEYGINPDISTFQLYNYELSEFVTSFSRENKRNGGKSISKSQLIEALIGFAVYDLNLTPDGYDSVQELTKELKTRLN